MFVPFVIMIPVAAVVIQTLGLQSELLTDILTSDSQLSCARTDITNGSPALIHVVYLLAGTQYNGQYTMPQYRGYWNDDDFMTFSPFGPPYIQLGTPGSYL
jgi:hypothetical protein